MTDDRKTMPGDWDALVERPTEISRERSSFWYYIKVLLFRIIVNDEKKQTGKKEFQTT